MFLINWLVTVGSLTILHPVAAVGKKGGSEVLSHYKGKKPFKPYKCSSSSSNVKSGAASVHTMDFDNQCD